MLLISWLALSAYAQDLPTWRWDPEVEHRYLVQANFQSPYVLFLLAEQNHEVRAAQVLIGAVMSCRLHTQLKKSADVICDAENASVLALPLSTDRGRATPILLEYEAILEQAEIRFRSTPDGRLRDLRLRGVDESDERQRYIVDTARRFFERALSPMDVPTPPAGSGPGSTWPYKDPLAGKLPVSLSLIGSFRFVEQVVGVDDGVWTLSGAGDGLVAVSDDRWEVTYASERRFDVATGAPLTASTTVTGTATAGSPITNAGDPVPYAIRATVERLGPGDSPPLVPSGEL